MNQFSIDYPEFHIAGQLQNDFPKGSDYSIAIPLSRQQKHYDLLLHSGKNKKCLAIQVKSSRTYIRTEADPVKEFTYTAWLNNFKIDGNHSDFYFIFISYPLFDLETFRPKAAFGVKILAFNRQEMTTLLANIKRTKSGNPDKFYSLVFNMGDNRIFGDRGFQTNPRVEFTTFFYENKLDEIKNAIS